MNKRMQLFVEYQLQLNHEMRSEIMKILKKKTIKTEKKI